MSIIMNNPLENPNNERPIITPDFIADYLNISYNKAKLLVKSGDIRGVRVGREYRVSPKNFIAYLRSIGHEGGEEEAQKK